MIKGKNTKSKTNPGGMMDGRLQKEVSKYGDFCQMTYPNFKHFGRPHPHERLNAYPSTQLSLRPQSVIVQAGPGRH